jgi:hypothetical protein
MTNPWGLTSVQCETLAAMIEQDGQRKAVAAALCVSHAAVVSRVRESATKMGAPTTFASLLAYDRWQRAHGKPQ